MSRSWVDVILKTILRHPAVSALVFVLIAFVIKPEWGETILRIRDPVLIVAVLLGATVWLVWILIELKIIKSR